MSFKLTILGSNSAVPTSNRNPTAQILSHDERLFLIDCGEGTQMQLRKCRFNFNKINHIFISHLHGDHFFGLIGLISTFNLIGRNTDLHIYAHSEIKTILQSQLDFIQTDMTYQIKFHPLNLKKLQVVYEDKKIIVSSFPLKHRIPTCGFLFSEKQKQPNLRKDMIEIHNIPISSRVQIKEGADFVTAEGKLIPNDELVIVPARPCSYAFCSDTSYNEEILPIIRGVDLLYHEATFANDNEALASSTGHSTAAHAARIALKAEAGRLIIGHFSARYKDVSPLLKEAKEIFKDTIAAIDGMSIKIENIQEKQ
ncbi:MAG: ribonuclease Z [Bacteroidota bacterium]|nr:ribonuclease Z [Bacteroidota bacterium]